jgi:hypothetical protein
MDLVAGSSEIQKSGFCQRSHRNQLSKETELETGFRGSYPVSWLGDKYLVNKPGF